MAENIENNGCSQRDNAEHEGYVKAPEYIKRIMDSLTTEEALAALKESR